MKNHTRSFFVLILLLMVSLLFLTTIAEGAKIKLRVTVESANIRLKPTIESTVISKAPLGAILESEEKVGNWYKVNLPPDESGFIISGYIHESIVEAVEEIEEISAKESVEEKKISKVEKPTKEKEEEKGEVAWIISKESKDKRKEEKKKEISPIVTRKTEVKEEILVKTKNQGITGGVRIGLSSANLHGENVEEFEEYFDEELKSKLGFCFGGFVTYNINEMFAIQPEVLFTMKGARIEEEIFGETLKGSINLNYLEIPILAKLTIPTQSNIKPILFAGPSFAIKLSSKAKAEYAGESEEEDIEDCKGTDFCLIIGAGIDFGLDLLSKGKLAVDLRYTLGLTTISKEENVDTKNGLITLMVGYYF